MNAGCLADFGNLSVCYKVVCLPFLQIFYNTIAYAVGKKLPVGWTVEECVLFGVREKAGFNQYRGDL